MRILLISDIHGNYAALREVLDRENYDKVYCMGDLVDYGPSPERCVTEIKNIADVVVRGNHDNAVATGADCGCSYEIKDLSEEVRTITKDIMSEESIEFLKNMPFDDKKGDFYFTHASKNDLYKYIKPDTPEEEFDDFSDIDQEIVFLGHTHLPMDRRVGKKRFINPGSVGQPRDGDPRASYAVWEEGKVNFKRMDYDIGGVKEKLSAKDFPARTKRILEAGKVVP